MARFRLTVEVRSATAPVRRPLRRTARPSRIAALGRRIGAIDLPGRRLRVAGGAAAVLLMVVGAFDYAQPVPAASAAVAGPGEYRVPGTSPSLPWPDSGSAAVGASGLGVIATSGNVSPTPAASLAKVMTAMVVLRDMPLDVGQSGPMWIITDQDVASYTSDAAQQQSVVEVSAGERLTEYQALEALLIPSGNNIAETLARWDAGSISAFVAKMNERAAALHLTQTTFADAAGVSIQTVTTPRDMVVLAAAAMQLPVLAEIVNLPQTTLPVAGTVYNVNGALGQDGIVGIKTGFGLDLGANFLFAATATVDGQEVTLLGCLMGQPTLDGAFKGAGALIDAMKAAIHVRPIVAAGDVVGAYTTGWGTHSDLIATGGVRLVEWPGMSVRERVDSTPLGVDTMIPGGTPAGSLVVVAGEQEATVALVTAGALTPPGLLWRLWRIPLG